MRIPRIRQFKHLVRAALDQKDRARRREVAVGPSGRPEFTVTRSELIAYDSIRMSYPIWAGCDVRLDVDT
jgi:hypothetical protein